MVQITATREIRYAGKRVLPGETIDVPERDARVLVAVKRATHAQPVVAQPVPAMLAMTSPAAEPEEEAAPVATAHPQTYVRRDMMAEPGPTGPASLSPSSRPARQRRART